MFDPVKDTYLVMKGWDRFGGEQNVQYLACIGCNNRFKEKGTVAGGHLTTYLNMKVAPHWPMCGYHAFKAQTGYDKGEWRQERHFNGSSW